MKVRYLGLLILCFNLAYATSFDALGKVYEIAEKDALSWLSSRLIELGKKGEVERLQASLRQQALRTLESPKKVEGLQKTTQERTFERDLTMTLPYDIQDHQGRLLYRAGTQINPLEKVVSKKALLFFDGEDKDQVAWALKEQKVRSPLAKLVMVNGSIATLARTQGVKLYFDQVGRLVKHFAIKQVPAIVEQQGDKLRIKEIKI